MECDDDARLLALLAPRADVAGIDVVPGMRVRNKAVTFSLDTGGRDIDLRQLTQHFVCTKFRPHQFGACILHIIPKLAVLIFARGACNCVGTSTYNEARWGSQVVRLMVQEVFPAPLGYEAGLCFQNTVLSIDIGFQLNIAALEPLPGDQCTLTDDFPGARYKMHGATKIKITIFDSGRLTFVGRQSAEDTRRAYRAIYPELVRIRTRALPTSSSGRFQYRQIARAQRAAALERELSDWPALVL